MNREIDREAGRGIGGSIHNGANSGGGQRVDRESRGTLKGERVRLLLDILLFAINVIGIVGAFMEAFLVDWRSEFNQPLLWGGLIVLSAVSVLWWRGLSAYGRPESRRLGNGGIRSNKRIVWVTITVVIAYAALIFLFREAIVNGLAWSFRNVLGLFDEYYGSEESLWRSYAELLQKLAEAGGGTAEAGTLCLLAALFPAGLLTGLFFHRGKWQVFLVEDILWFWAACLTDVFPGAAFLALCVMGIALAAAVGEFRDNVAAWAQAAVGIMALTFLGIILMQRLVLPVLDEQYERSTALRHKVYVTVNYKWMPGLQRLFKGGSFGAGVDVTGAFGRQHRASGIMSDVYRVTLDTAPRRTLYLRGFIGKEYNRRRWEPENEGDLERYYRANGFTLYEDGRELLNMGFAAAQDSARTNTVTIEELLGQGSYSLIPYGVLVTEDYPVHSGGTVDRVGSGYSFLYRDMLTVGGDSFTEQWRQVEEQYRQYVYDNFLDYPEDRLPRLTQALEEEALPKGDVYRCASAILDYLEENAVYKLDVASTPVGEDYVEYFLFESHEGFCAHFASAAVLMFRHCGIPARYATGYSASASFFSRTEDNLYTANLTGAQAHAWAEVYVDGVGWVPVEATPGAAAFAGDNRSELLRRLGILTGDIEPTIGGAIVDDDEEEEEELDDGIRLPLLPYEDEEELEDEEEVGPRVWGAGDFVRLVIIAAAAAVLFVVLYGRIRRRCWNRKLRKAEGQDKIFLLYRNMRNALQVMGCSRQFVLTGDAFWEKLQKLLPSQSREDYDMVCAILEQSSFGNRAPSGEEIETLESLHDDIVSRLYLNAPFYKKRLFAGLACVLPASYRTYSLKLFEAK